LASNEASNDNTITPFDVAPYETEYSEGSDDGIYGEKYVFDDILHVGHLGPRGEEDSGMVTN